MNKQSSTLIQGTGNKVNAYPCHLDSALPIAAFMSSFFHFQHTMPSSKWSNGYKYDENKFSLCQIIKCLYQDRTVAEF